MSEQRVYKDEFLYLTTTGWKSGNPHEIEIWYVAHNGCYYLCAEQRERSHWVRNIQHQPSVTVRVKGKVFAATGRPLDAGTDAELISAVAGLFNQQFQWSDGLLVELCPA
ncbi:MAG: nitroreductase family deazaflavin-dependent oxidoreductase [Anaerolineae bacterium]